VHGLLKTENAVSPTHGVGTILFSLISFVLIYALLMVIDIYLLVKYGRTGPDRILQGSVEDAPSVVGEQE
jgi:cytochrome d ubiquinol oxidase subunit I